MDVAIGTDKGMLVGSGIVLALLLGMRRATEMQKRRKTAVISVVMAAVMRIRMGWMAAKMGWGPEMEVAMGSGFGFGTMERNSAVGKMAATIEARQGMRMGPAVLITA